jgi:hypothetical protein
LQYIFACVFSHCLAAWTSLHDANAPLVYLWTISSGTSLCVILSTVCASAEIRASSGETPIADEKASITIIERRNIIYSSHSRGV